MPDIAYMLALHLRRMLGLQLKNLDVVYSVYRVYATVTSIVAVSCHALWHTMIALQSMKLWACY